MGLVELGGVARGELFGCFLAANVSLISHSETNELDCTCAIVEGVWTLKSVKACWLLVATLSISEL